MEECRYELKNPFQYAYKGDSTEAGFVTMTAPNYGNISQAIPIKQAFASAIKEKFSGIVLEDVQQAQENATPASTEDDDSGFGAVEVMAVLFSWSGDLTKVFKNADSLFKAGAAQLDGETKITSGILEKMSLADFEGMVGTYLANFIVPSLTDGQ